MAKRQISKVVINGNTINSGGPWVMPKVSKSLLAKASEPVKGPEADFSEIKDLISNKPLQFNPSRSRQR